MMRRPALLALLPLTVVSACATGHHFDRSTEPGASETPTTVDVKVLTEDQLSVNPGWSVLDALHNTIPGLKIRSVQPPGCPILLLRGQDTIQEGTSNPDVYVDGTRTNDTCTLTSLQAAQVRRVEVYPMGYSPRAGYPGGAHGLILIFLKRAEGDAGGARL